MLNSSMYLLRRKQQNRPPETPTSDHSLLPARRSATSSESHLLSLISQIIADALAPSRAPERLVPVRDPNIARLPRSAVPIHDAVELIDLVIAPVQSLGIIADRKQSVVTLAVVHACTLVFAGVAIELAAKAILHDGIV